MKPDVSRHIPNIITFMRFPLTLLLLFFMQRSEYSIAIAVFVVICLTDIFDGIVARTLAACTRFGAYMDVSADLFYVMSSLIVLNTKEITPSWFTVITALKFVEFTVTSSILKRSTRKNSAWIFDRLGHTFAVLAFIAPGVFCIAAIYTEISHYIIYLLVIPACVFAAISSVARIVRCLITPQ